MAIITRQYCSGALDRIVTINYNDVTHAISSHSVGVSSCGASSPGAGTPSGTILYTQIDGTTQYNVRVQNSPPYAYVETYAAPPCTTSITSTVPTNASTNEATNGSIVVNATGNGVLAFSKDDGLSYQSGAVFNNLAPGVYKIRVRNTYGSQECFATANVTVGFNAIVCRLKLENITVDQPSAPGGSDGSISVNTLTNPPALPVEYRIGAGAWQTSPVFTGLAAGTYNVQVRYRDHTTCTDNRDVVVVDATSCDAFIQNIVITHEQSKFGDNGGIEVVAVTTAGPLEYSIDDGANYQSSKFFTELPPGVYEVRIKDANNCEDARTVEVLNFKTPHIDIPVANAHRFVITSGPGIDNSLQNFDNTLFKDMRFPDVEPGCYAQQVQQGDSRTQQFRSNYTNHTLKVMRESDNSEAGSVVVQKLKDFTRQSETIDALLCDAGGNKTQVFFENGLPEWAEVGQDITLGNTGEVTLDGETFEILEIKEGILNAVGFVVLIIDVTFPAAGTISGEVTAVYDFEPFDVFEFVINWSAFANDRYYLKLEGSDDQFSPFTALSEPIDLATTHADTLLIEWYNSDNAFKMFYDTGIVNKIRVEGEFKWPVPGGEETNHEDSRRRVDKLEENVTRNPQLLLWDVTPYLAEKLGLILAHDVVTINGVRYVKQDEKVEIIYIDHEALCNTKVKVRQYDFVAENSDDQGDVDVPVTVLEVNGVLLRINP